MSELINISKEWKSRADQLLSDRGLVRTLSKFGTVHFTGAYLYDLMMHGDIDISVVRDQEFSAEEVFEIFRELYFQGRFRSYFIGGDWDDPRKGNEFPKGYYIGLKEKLGREKWKFDIWFLSEGEFTNRSGILDLKDISREQKELILSCKQYRNIQKIPTPGQEIYERVLGGEWKSLEDFKTVLNKKA